MTNASVVAAGGNLILIALALFFALRMIYFGRPSGCGDRLHFLLGTAGRVLLSLGVFLWLACLSPGPLAMLWLCVAAIFAARADLVHHQAKQRATWQYVQLARRANVPPGEALLALSEDFGGLHGRRLRRAALLLQAGRQPPVRLLQRIYSRQGELLLQLDQNLPPGNESVAADPLSGAAMQRLFGNLTGLLLGAGIAVAVVAGVVIFILPEMAKITFDFGVEAPLLDAALRVPGEYGSTLLAFAAVVLLGLIAALLTLALQFSGAVGAAFPWGFLFRDVYRAFVLRLLANQLAAGRPLPQALGALAQSFPSSWTKRGLRKAAQAVDRGQPWQAALVSARLLPGREAPVLAAAAQVGNLPGALRAAAESLQRRTTFRVHLAIDLIGPLIVSVVGLLVLALSALFFDILARLIEGLAG